MLASEELFWVAEVAVNPFIPVAFKVAPESTTTTSLSEPEEPPKSVTVSDPESTVIISSPSPPVMISDPAPPEIVSIPAFPTIVSTAPPPVIISAPAPPLRVSAPSPPTILKAFELPVASETSIVLPPPSLAFKTALLAFVELFCVVDFAVNPIIFVAFTDAPELTIITSSSDPDPPKSVTVSVPEVALKVSFPLPPVTLSSPAPPSKTSSAPFPSIMSFPDPPVIISALDPPRRS